MIHTYKQARDYITSLSSRGIVPGLDAIYALCNELGNPQDKIRTLHIAGTNGKGSTGAFISGILRAAGYSVGRYVSPAVSEYCEIIRVNDAYISEDEYTEIVNEIEKAINAVEARGIYPTSFEAETAAAFLYFVKKKCDYSLIECGMGGELDATNIIKAPIAAVITSIGMDHAAFLGDTIEKIAQSKSGIIKENIPVFSARQTDSVMRAIIEKCIEKNAELTVAKVPEIVSADLKGTVFNYGGMENVKIPLAGAYQPMNAVLAIEVCKHLNIDGDTIMQGLRDTKWSLRFECDDDGWIFDGAHNVPAAKALVQSVKELLDGRTAYIIGVFADKEYKKIIEVTSSGADRIYTVTAPGARGLDSSVLASVVRQYCTDTVDAVTTENAVRLCAKEGFDNVVVFGSLSFLDRIKHEKEKVYEEMSKNI